MSVKVAALGLAESIKFFEVMPDTATKAMSISINQVAQRGGMRLAQDAIYEQVAFPKDYLKGDRLMVAKFSRPNDLEAVIRGRKRATSLARFAKGSIGGGQFLTGGGRAPTPPISLRVKTNAGTALRSAWLVRLNRGASFDEDNYNVGLAVRVKKGEKVLGKSTKHDSWLTGNPEDGGVALLYGPSVDQVFRDVADSIGEPILNLVTAEFFRQFARLSGA